MPSIEYRPDRPKRYRARYWGPDGKLHSRSFARKDDAQRWLVSEEVQAQGHLDRPQPVTAAIRRLGRRVVGGLVLQPAAKPHDP